MAEPDKNYRKPKINKDKIMTLLQKIGVHTLPKGSGTRKGKVVPHASNTRPHLTAGSSVDAASVARLEQQWRSAYCLHDGQTPLRHKRRKRANFRSLQTYRSRLDTCKLERLFVAEESKLAGKSITQDIDPEFYSIVAGRPVKERGNLQEHKWAVRSSFLTRLQTGRLQDEVRLMEEAKNSELQVFRAAQVALKRQEEAFDRFLQEDYRSSAEWLSKAEAAAVKTQQKEEMINELNKEVGSMKTRVVLLEEQWRKCKMLQQFLYSVAPLQWRRLHDYIHKKGGSIDPTEASVFERLRGASLTVKDEMSSKIARFFGETRTCDAPALYFNDPEQLFAMFHDLEERNLGSLLQCERLQPSVLTMERARAQADELFESERAVLADDVAELRRMVEVVEARATALQQEAMGISQHHLHRLLTNRQAINLTACLEDAYERAVGPNDSGLGPVAMMRALETTHETLRLQLDILPSNLVGRITNAWEKEDKRLMQEAKVASKKVHQMDMLVKRFSSALKPWTPHATRRLVRRSQPPKEKTEKGKPPRALTIAELEYQHFFEEQTADTDPDRMYRPLC